MSGGRGDKWFLPSAETRSKRITFEVLVQNQTVSFDSDEVDTTWRDRDVEIGVESTWTSD